MNEEERYYYKKILRDCVMPEGLFEIKDRESNFYLIIENKKDVDTITNLLNQQDKRIKELKEENQQLKQSQKQLAIEELEKLEEEMSLNGSDYCEIRQGTSPHNPTDYAWFNYVVFRKFINNQIKSLKGEK